MISPITIGAWYVPLFAQSVTLFNVIRILSGTISSYEPTVSKITRRRLFEDFTTDRISSYEKKERFINNHLDRPQLGTIVRQLED
ncbi:hypothetical protein Tco_0296673 [Tanacetum coccineum]